MSTNSTATGPARGSSDGSEDAGVRGAARKASVASGADSPAAGLVYNHTTDTREGTVDVGYGHTARLRRLQRGVLTSARLIDEHFRDAGYAFRVAPITLTYRPGVDWHANRIRSTLKCYREWARRRGIALSYVWVMELQGRGVPHYHLLVWLPRGWSPPLPDKQGWWPHGASNARWVRERDNAVYYVAKYASKGYTGFIPRDARLWGVGGLHPDVRARLSWEMAPSWLRGMVPYGCRIVHRAGWWLDCVNRIRYRSPWVLDGFSPFGVRLLWVGWTIDDVEFV